jgi:hypothetical protein
MSTIATIPRRKGVVFATLALLLASTSGIAAQAPEPRVDPAPADTGAPAEAAEPSTPEPAVPEPEPVPEAEEEEPAPTVRVRLGGGLTVESADGRFAMTLRGRAQLRYEGTFSELRGDADGSSQFQARRVRLLLQGHLFDEHWKYYIQLGFSNRDTESDLRLPLRDAYMTYDGVRDMNVRFGQGKVPYGRQRVVSSSALQFPDRSIVTNEFNLDRDVGIQIFSNDLFGLGERLGYNLGIYGGDGRNRVGNDFGMLYVARLTTTPFGKFDEFVEADHSREDAPRLALSIGGALNFNSVRTRSTFDQTFTLGSYDYVHAGADLLFKMSGVSLQAEFFYRDVMGTRVRTDDSDPLDILTETTRTGFGFYAQGGYMFNDHVELVARYGMIRPRPNRTTALGDQGEMGLGLNYYFQRHDFKIQLDWYLQHEGETFDQSEREHHIRIQTQFYL